MIFRRISYQAYLRCANVTYAISFNGKARFNLTVDASTSREQIEQLALNDPQSARWMEGKTVKKVIVVPNKIVNIVIA